MQGHEARILLGFPPNSSPTLSQIKAAYRKKVWESHPDLFPVHEKPCAESRFKSISEAYTYLLSDVITALYCADCQWVGIDPGWASHCIEWKEEEGQIQLLCLDSERNILIQGTFTQNVW